MVFDSDYTLTHRYMYGPGIDMILADEAFDGASGNFLDLYWMLGDHQGSVTSVLSHNSGQTSVVQQLAYSAFGAIGSIKDGQGNNVTTGPISRFAYTGREFDPETGDYYYRARYYDPQTGRFLSQDPIGFAAGDMNLYRYVGNSSPNWVDPSGLRADERMTSGPSSPIGHAGPVRYNDGAPYEMLPGFRPPGGDQSNYYWRTNGFGDPVLDPTIIIVPPGPVGGPIMIVEPPATGIPPEPTIIVRPPGSFPGDPRVLEPLPGMPKWITDVPYECAVEGPVFTARMLSQAIRIAKGARIDKVLVIVQEYGGEVRNWRKMKGWDDNGCEWHWYEHQGIGRVLIKKAGDPDPPLGPRF